MHTYIRCGLLCYVCQLYVDSAAIFTCTFYDAIDFIIISPNVSLPNGLQRLLRARQRTVL